VFALAGVGLASWQLTKVGLPESCMSDPVAEFVNTLPSADWWPEYLFATGGCGAKLAPILGLTVPEWSLLWFSLFALLSVLSLVRIFLVGNRKNRKEL
jgi:disulfide bond formation protein DsbB